MRIISLLLPALGFSLFSCTPVVDHQTPEHLRVLNLSSNYQLPELSASDKAKLGKKIWANESSGKVSGLTHWNTGEEFPSMGIGHFIWYPKNYKGPFNESFPLFVNYAKARKAALPTWVASTPDCPWSTRTAFYKDFNGSKLTELRTFLKNNVSLQTDFIIQKSRGALPKMLAAASPADQAKVLANYKKVASTANGTYALIDYENFKGDGTKTSERYNGQGWGMLQVLINMKETSGGQASAVAFAESAKAVLLRRVKNAPASRNESQWTAGWNNRCDTYAKPL